MRWRGITRFRKVKQNIQNLWSRDGLKCRPVSIQSLCSLCHVILLLSMNVLVTRAPHPSRWLGHSRVSCCHRAQSSRPSSPIGRGRMCTRSGWSQKYTYKVHLPKMQCVKWGLYPVGSVVHMRPLSQVQSPHLINSALWLGDTPQPKSSISEMHPEQTAEKCGWLGKTCL